jgi:tetratricopeptide (TPR) repeat protein
VQAVLAARIDRLPLEDKRLLQTAAVVGTDVPCSLLRAIADVSEETLHRGLACLQAAEFLYETRLFPEPEYTFKHVLTYEVAYGSLLLERRRGLRAAFREAVAHFERARQALAHLPEHDDTRILAIEIRLAFAPPLAALAEYGRRLALLSEAEILVRALDDRAPLGRVLAEIAQVRRITGDQEGAIAAGQRALDLAVELGDSALQGQASSTLGQAYYVIGDFVRAAELLRRSVEATERGSSAPSTDMRNRSQAWLARALHEIGAFAEGQRHGEEALRLARLEGQGPALIVAHAGLGLLYLGKGDLEHAIRLLDQGLALIRASGDRGFLRPIVLGLGSAYALQGRLAEGRALLEEGISESIRTNALQNRAHLVAWLSEVCRLTGHYDEAWQHAQQVLDVARQQKTRGGEVLALHQLGVVHAYADPPDAAQAETHYQQALALAEALGMRPLVAHCHLGLGRLYGQTGCGEQAHAALTTAIGLYRAMEMAFWLPQAEAALAQQVEGQ